MGKAMKLQALSAENEKLRKLTKELAMLVRLLVEGVGSPVVLLDSVQRRVIQAPAWASDVHLETEEDALVLTNRMEEYLEGLEEEADSFGGLDYCATGPASGEGARDLDPEGTSEEPSGTSSLRLVQDEDGAQG